VPRKKRIVLCADGTWNDAERVDESTGRPLPTNVLKLARSVSPLAPDGTTQVVYYHFGVGTGGGLDRLTGGAFGAGIEENVRALYRFLVYNYEQGDEIYLFGFSRGAFTVRTLVGFMKKLGLLSKTDEYYTPNFYRLYESGLGSESPEWQEALSKMRLENRRGCPEIMFIGVWDTVGSLGAPGFLGQVFNRHKYDYHDIELNEYVRNAYHALAIDECRRPFLPSLWKRPKDWGGHLEQVWFPGVHCNVGGSYHPDGLADEALQWMVEKAEGCGLHFDNAFLDYYHPCFNSNINDSMSPMYELMGPVQRQIGQHLTDGEAIHQSAIDRLNYSACSYQPANLRAFLESNPNPPIATTTRMVANQHRGVPCKARPESPRHSTDCYING
jgi:uncharacterized protein (DUF2235 family)